MGCHGGYNVPDEFAVAGRQLDFAQALAGRGVWWLGNTGYGYGMDGDIQASPGRPVQPRMSQELPMFSGMW